MKESSKAKLKASSKAKDCGRTLWIWIGIGSLGDWVPILTNCKEGATPFKPPRPGERPLEVIWTLCSCPHAARGEVAACNGYCEYRADGSLRHDGCSTTAGCSCLRQIVVDTQWQGVGFGGGIGTITECNSTVEAKSKQTKN